MAGSNSRKVFFRAYMLTATFFLVAMPARADSNDPTSFFILLEVYLSDIAYRCILQYYIS
jgi:hypothetical protein